MFADSYDFTREPQMQGMAQALAPRDRRRGTVRDVALSGGARSPAAAQEPNPYADFDRGSRVPQSTSAFSPTSGASGADISGIMSRPQGIRGGPIDLTGPDGQTRKLPSTPDYLPRGSPLPWSQSQGSGAPANTSAPSAPSGLGQYASALEGVDAGKLNSEHDSPKYRVMRVLSHYPPTPEGLQQALPALKALGLADDVAITGSKGDKLKFLGAADPRFEGMTEFDVIRAAGLGGQGWQWGAETGAAPSAGGGSFFSGANNLNAPSAGGQDPYAMLDGAALGGTDHSSGVLRYLLEQLGIGQALGRN